MVDGRGKCERDQREVQWKAMAGVSKVILWCVYILSFFP